MNADAGVEKLTVGKIADTGLTFLQHSGIPAFAYDFFNTNTTSSRTCRVSPSTTFILQCGRAGCTFINSGMSDCPASNQSGKGMNKNADARTSPVSI